jgi:hypothetical protein
MSTTIGYLAAQELIHSANMACKRTAKALRTTGEKLGCQWSDDGAWSFLQDMIVVLGEQHKTAYERDGKLKELRVMAHGTMQGLAERRIYTLMDDCLVNLVKETEYLCSQITIGEQLRLQYDEGLITATEYLLKLIEQLSLHKDS